MKSNVTSTLYLSWNIHPRPEPCVKVHLSNKPRIVRLPLQIWPLQLDLYHISLVLITHSAFTTYLESPQKARHQLVHLQ